MIESMTFTFNDPDGKPTGQYKGYRIKIGRLWIELHWQFRSLPTGDSAK